MGADLPSIDEESFFEKILAVSPRKLSLPALNALWVHYQELRRWNRRLSLIGPGTVEDPWRRHYGESLAALELLEDPHVDVPESLPAPPPLHLVDIGSGGGFPGFALAAALGAPTILVEARQRKWAFLQSVCRKAGLPCTCLNARVSRPLPPGLPPQISVLTLRALRLSSAALEDLASRLDPGGRLLLWQTEPFDEPPPGFVQGRVLHLEGSERRSIVELVVAPEPSR